MYHHFDIDIASKYGLNEAILLNNIAFWVFKNKANGQNCYEGKYWTFNSIKAYAELFPYMSESTIRRTLKNLESNGLILISNFGSSTFNKTNYYTLTHFGEMVVSNWREAFSHFDNMEEVKMTGSLFNKNTDSTDINSTDINNISPVIPREVAELDSMFEQFWKAYPKKVDPKGCKKKFIKIKNLKQLFPTIIQALEIQKRSTQWNEENGRYIPNPSTWINQERWNTVNEVAEKQTAIEDAVSDKVGDFF